MNRKLSLIAIIIFGLSISLVVGLQAVDVAKANPIAYGPPRIAIVSPQYGITYNSSQVTLSVGIQLFGYTYTSLEAISWVRYALDNGITAPLNLEMSTVIGPGTMINSTNTISNLSDGNHSLNIFLETSFGESVNANVTFIVDTKPSPTPSASPTSSSTPTITARLSESASALNFGNTVNFTVVANGGTKPYTYTWNIEQSSDSIIVETTTSPYYSSDTFSVGSHHVYVEITDAANNSATTLTVEFNVLSASSSSPNVSPNLSSSPTQTPTLEPSLTASSTKPPHSRGDEDFIYTAILIVVGLVALAVMVGIAVYHKRRRE
jgi:hypothetical protein